MSKKLISIFLAMFMLLISAPQMMLAQDADGTPAPESSTPLPSMVFEPTDANEGGRLTATLEPGESVTFTVFLGNNGEIPFRFVTYAADAFSARNGGFGLFELDSEVTGATTWLDYQNETYLLQPGDGLERMFEVRVPEGTAPGEYVTGVAMQTADPVNEATEDMFRFDQIFRTVLGIKIVVPGEMQAALNLGTPEMIIEGGIPGVRIPIANTGNMQTTTEGHVQISTAAGEVVLAGEIELGPIYGGHATEILIGLPAPLSPGDYLLDLALKDGDGVTMVDAASVAFAVAESQSELAETSPTTIASATLAPSPNASNVQLVVIDATIANTAEPIANAQLSLIVSRDGVEVERSIISQSLALPNGETVISERYLPLTGWSSGAWTFELVLESVGSGDVVAILDRHVFDEAIEIP